MIRRYVLLYFCLGPKPPTNINITSSKSNQLDVTWVSHCNSVENCLENRIPEKYTVTYKPICGSMEMTAIVESPNPPYVFPNTSVKLTDGIISNTEYEVSVTTNIYRDKDDGRTVQSDSSNQTGITSTSVDLH